MGDSFIFSTGLDCAAPDSVDIALVNRPPRQGWQAFTQLRAIISLSAGINQFIAAQMPNGVPLSRSVDPTLTQQMIAYAKTAVYRYHRRFHEFEQNTRSGIWRFTRPLSVQQTSVGVLGLGEIGSAIAQALAADQFAVQGWSRSRRELQGVTTHGGDDGLKRMVSEVGIVINVLPLTDSTRGILAAPLFSRFRRGTFLINMGRGPHLVENDLLEALASGQIAAATLDVAQVEPLPQSHDFWAHQSILVTPHVAGISSADTAAPQVAENIRRAMRGEVMAHKVDLARGY